MNPDFPTLRREAAALRLTKPQIEKLVADAAYDRKYGALAHPKVFQTGRLLAAADEDAQRLRDAAIADCLPTRMKASSTSYAPGPMTAPRPKPEAKPATEAPGETPESFADFWRSLNQPEAPGDDQPEAKAPKPPAKIELPALDTEAPGDAETPPSGEFKAFWDSLNTKTETANRRFWKSAG